MAFNPLDLLNPIKLVRDIFDDLHTSDEEKADALQRLTVIENNFQTKLIEAQSKVIVTEARGNWMQRSWRPCLGFAFTTILVNNYIFAPYIEMFWPNVVLYLEPPPEFWTSLWYLVGGYMGLRTVEKTVRSLKS